VNSIRVVIVLLALTVLSQKTSSASLPKSFACIGGYERADPETGRRVDALLSEHHLFHFAIGAAIYSITVSSERAAEARVLLAKAVKEEGLNFTFYGPMNRNGAGYETVPADSILSGTTDLDSGSKQPKKKKGRNLHE
jgi:hypothetical protein